MLGGRFGEGPPQLSEGRSGVGAAKMVRRRKVKGATAVVMWRVRCSHDDGGLLVDVAVDMEPVAPATRARR